jgi:hypothetical protein
MSSILTVNGSPSLQQKQHPAAMRFVAQIISYIFHPVFVPLYVLAFLAFVHPYLYAGFPLILKKTAVMGSAFMAFTFFPIITVLLLKGLKFIDSFYLNTQKDRIIPLIACMIWYFWAWYIWKNFGNTYNAVDMPVVSVKFAFAAFLSTIFALMANIKMKISLHAISVGLMLAFMCLLSFSQELNFGIYLSIAIFITGLVCTARLIVSNHSASEVYGGLVAGASSMLLAWWVA